MAESGGNREYRFFLNQMVYIVNRFANIINSLGCRSEYSRSVQGKTNPIMEEKKISEKESLEIITEMISRTKERYIGDGNIMLMWGYLTVSVAALVWVMLILTHNPAWNWLWFAIGVVGGIFTPILDRRQRHRNGVKSYSDTFTSRIWTTVGVSFIIATFLCLGFLLIGGVDSWTTMLLLAVMIVPLIEIVQGIMLSEKSLQVGGWVGLVVGIVTTCCITGKLPLNTAWFMPMFIVAFAAMMIVPGHILNAKSRRK